MTYRNINKIRENHQKQSTAHQYIIGTSRPVASESSFFTPKNMDFEMGMLCAAGPICASQNYSQLAHKEC